jgi:glycerol uptake facilitator-like aquaporin
VLRADVLQMTRRPLVGECLGTAFLLMAIVGSGIMAERLSGGNVALALLANAAATGAALLALILTFGPVSGAHLNPAVSAAAASHGDMSWPLTAAYVAAQVIGAFIGVGLSNAMFGEPAFAVSRHVRTGWPLWLSEFLATFGLLAVISSCARRQPATVPFAVAAYITGAYWFTSSTSFANPAVTLARAATDTFAGIRPIDVPAFIMAQTLGAACAVMLFSWLVPAESPTSEVRMTAATAPGRMEI